MSRSAAYGTIQTALFAGFAAVHFLDPGPRTVGGDPVGTVLGDVLSLAGVALLFVALQTIGKSIQIAPAPRRDAVLVTHGVYRVLRHPIYTAIVLILVGLVMRGATAPATGLAAAAIAFLLVKARYEERLLGAHYPEYEEYRRRTWGVLF
ncbi:MAG: isoprenylcysteine carboxylmethyltransferase family protein [Candidatus Eisenbacteria bacterium]